MTSSTAIELTLGRLHHRFASASQLRDALLQSFGDADFAGGPFVMVTLDDARPAWSWVVELLRTRSDWWPSIGIALQHAVLDGPHLCRVALADLLANFRDSAVLHPWVAALAAELPEVRATSSDTGWGGSTQPTLSAIVRDQATFLQTVARVHEVFVDGVQFDRPNQAQTLATEQDLLRLLEESARRGGDVDGHGPWGWLLRGGCCPSSSFTTGSATPSSPRYLAWSSGRSPRRTPRSTGCRISGTCGASCLSSTDGGGRRRPSFKRRRAAGQQAGVARYAPRRGQT